MQKKTSVDFHDTKSFYEHYVTPSPTTNKLFKAGFENFFCIPIENIIEHVNFPFLPTKEEAHSLIFINSGYYKSKVGFVEYRVFENQILIIPAQAIFSSNYKPDKEVKGYFVHFHPNMLLGLIGNQKLINQFDFLKVWGNPFFNLEDKKTIIVEKLLERMSLEYACNGLDNKNLLQAYLVTILLELHAIYPSGSQQQSPSAIRITQHFKKLLHDSFHREHQVSAYAKQLNISSNHLNKVVKLITNKSPTKWIQVAIVTEAKYRLFQTNDSINQIANDLGFEDTSYFSRLFKKIEGQSPSEFRKMIEKS